MSIAEAGFNPFDPTLVEDPHPTYRALRENAPAYLVEALGIWVVTDPDAGEAILRNPRSEMRFSDFQKLRQGLDALDQPYCRAMSHQVLARDGAEHRRIRASFARRFTPRRVAELRPGVEATAADLVSRIAGRGVAELVSEVAVPLPLATISELLGVPADANRRIAQWSLDFKPALQFLPMTDDELARANAAVEGLTGFFTELIARRRADPGDDLISALIADVDDDELTDAELVHNAWGLYVAGHETSSSLIANAVLTLDRNPIQRDALLADRSLLDAAVEEVLRYESPGQANVRVLGEPVTVGDTTIPAGVAAVVYFPALNRNPDRWADPDVFDINRPPAKNLAFSVGPHACPGQHLARLSLSIALDVLYSELPGLRVVDDTIDWHPTPLMRGPATLNVAWDV